MNIIDKFTTPDSTYFTITAIEPEIHDDELWMASGEGSRRGWGSPKSDYIIAYDSDSLTSVIIWNHHKHGGGQAWRHYVNDGLKWKRVLWRGLDDGQRMLILDAYQEDHVPGWVDVPGKLKRDYLKPKELQRLEIDEQGTIFAYKYLRYDAGTFYSVASISKGVAWIYNELEADREPTENNSNGIYAMKSRKHPGLLKYSRDDRVLVRLALSGTVIEGNEGLRAQHAQIVEVLS